MRQFIYHTDDYNGFKADFLQSEKTVEENKSMGVRQDWKIVCEVKPTKERGRNTMGFAYRIYESADGRKFQVYNSDYSAKEV